MDSIRKRSTNPEKRLPDPRFDSWDYFSNTREEQVIKNIPKRKAPTKKKSEFRKSKRSFLRKTFLPLFLLALFVSFSTGGYFLWKIYAVGKKITIEGQENNSFGQDLRNAISPISPFKDKSDNILSGAENGRINILLLGRAGEGKPGSNLTDTIMITSINTETMQAGLLSLPRDLYVEIPDTDYYTKINSVYQYGLDNDEGSKPIQKTVEKITGLDINYFMILDFDGFEKIIDDIGGINIFVERDIYDPAYPGPNYSYETFEIKKGLHTLDGATALKYVRERHDDPEGDFGRAKRQQQTIQAVKNKVFSLKTFLNVFTLNRLLNTMADNLKTNVRLSEIEQFIELSKKVDSQNISNVVVDAWKSDSLLKVSHVYYGDTRAFILVPRIGNYSEIQELAENLFNTDFIMRRRKEIEQEETSVAIMNQSNDADLTYKILDLLQKKLGFEEITILSNKNKERRKNTIIFDATSGEKPFSLDEITKKLPATLPAYAEKIKNIDSNSDFTVLLGEDLEKIYSYEESSIEEMQNAQPEQMHIDLIQK